MGSTSCRTELVSLRPKISTTPFLSQRHWSCNEPQSSPPRSLCPFLGRSAIGERPMPERAIISYRWGPRFVSLLFSPTRPSAVAKQPIIKLSCLLPHLPPTRILSSSLAEKLLNSCCHGHQRTVRSIPILASAVCYNFRFNTFGPIARSAHFVRIVLLPFVYLFCLSFLMRTLLAFFYLSSVVSVCFLQVLFL